MKKKSHKNNMIYDISYKPLIGSKPWWVKIYDGTRYLAFYNTKKCYAIYDRIRYLTTLKSSIRYIFSHFFAKIKVDSYYSLPREKRLTLHNVIILIKSVLNKDKNYYYYKIFLENAHIN